MSNQLSPTIRRRVIGSAKCAKPALYVSDSSSTYSESNIMKNGKSYDINPMYFFGKCDTPSSLLNWTITVYTSTGAVSGTYTGTTTIGTGTATRFGSTSGYTIPTGGRVKVEGYCTKASFEQSDSVVYTLYLTKQKLVVTMTDGGTYPFYKVVEMSSNYDSEIYYNTTTGNSPSQPPIPTTSSTLYQGQIVLTETTRIRAKAFSSSNEYTASDPVDVTYTISKPALTAPTLSLSPGTYNTAQNLTITNPNDYGNVFYTNDGSTPTQNSIPYHNGETIVLTETCTIKAIVIETISGSSSSVTTGSYTITSEPTVTVEVVNITGDSATFKGTLTYDANVYTILDGTSPYFSNVVGFKFVKCLHGNYAPAYFIEQSVTVKDVDLNQSSSKHSNSVVVTQQSNRSNIVTIKFEYNMVGTLSGTVLPHQVTAFANIFYNQSSQFFNDFSSRLYIESDTVTYYVLSQERGTYSLLSSTINCDIKDSSLNYTTSGTYNLSAILSPINVSFRSLSEQTSGHKRWGVEIIDTTRYITNTNPSTPYYYRIEQEFLRDPWSYIGNTSTSESDVNFAQFGNTNGDYYKVRDLFGWGTSFNNSYNNLPSGQIQTNYQPWSTSTVDTDYNPYNSSNSDLRNVRSRFLQKSPAEPNYQTGGAYQPPRLWGDWATIGIQEMRSTELSTSQMYLYASDGWNWRNVSSQGAKLQYSPRAFGLVENGEISGFSSNTDGLANQVATLSKDEWNYILFSRSGNRFAKGRIQCTDYYGHTGDYVNGLFIFSDTAPSSITNLFSSINTTSAAFSVNTITEDQWYSNFENWVTFLPAAGYRTGTTYSGGNADGYYWTRTFSTHTGGDGFIPITDPDLAWAVHFNNSTVEIVRTPRSRGCSVRLARYVYTQVS